MPLYDYRCPAGHETEALRPAGTAEIGCPCGAAARRVGAYRVAVLGAEVLRSDADTRQKFRRYHEAAEELNYRAVRRERATGRPTKTPDLWGHAKRRAAAMIAAGEAPALRKDN